jgi:hypothetical protein
VTEVRETRGALAQRELERRDTQELRTDLQDLEEIAGRGVDGDDAIAQTV